VNRNLPAYDRSRLALALEPLIAKKAESHKGGRGKLIQKSKRVSTSNEIAKAAVVSHDTLRGLAAAQKIPSVRIGGKLGFRRDEMLACFARAGRTTKIKAK
jgi:hypothetical protein